MKLKLNTMNAREFLKQKGILDYDEFIAYQKADSDDHIPIEKLMEEYAAYRVKNCNAPDVMCCGYWEKFIGQKLNTTDLVWFKKSGLAFVDSSVTTGEPDRFTSIPEAWTFGGSVAVNRRSFGTLGYSHVRKNGWVYRDKGWGGDKWDKLLYVCRVSLPYVK